MISAAYSSCSERGDSLLDESSCLVIPSLASSFDHEASPTDTSTLASSARCVDFCPHLGTNSRVVTNAVMMFRQQMLLEQRQAADDQSVDECSSSGTTDVGIRMIVVSWMVEVAEEFGLQQETLHMAVLLLDRFITLSEDVPHCVLQLLAIGCIMLAGKELEVYPPSVQQLCCVTANHFKPHDLLRMERIILNVLDFRVCAPSTYTFLHLLAQVCGPWLTPAVLSLAMYLCELAMLNSQGLSSGSRGDGAGDSSAWHSQTAVSALLLAQLSLGHPQHTPLIKAAAMDCLSTSSLDGLGRSMALLLRLQQIAYQHTLAAVAVTGGEAAASVVSPGTTFSAPAAAASFSIIPQALSTVGASQQADDLLAPIRIKFAAGCWCGVSTAPPLALLPPQV